MPRKPKDSSPGKTATAAKKRPKRTAKKAAAPEKPRDWHGVPAPWRPILLGIRDYDPFRDAAGYYFNVKEAERRIKFIETFCHHPVGRLAGQPYILSPLEKSIVANWFGWKRKSDDLPRYREGFIYWPRGNSKTTFSACLIASVMFQDGEANAEIYSAAAEKEQASIAYTTFVQMIGMSPELERRTIVKDSTKIVILKNSEGSITGTYYKPLSAEAYSKHGYKPYWILNDELHAQATREMTDTLETGMGKRSHAAIMHVSTADFKRPGSICNVKLTKARQVLNGGLRDPRFLPVIYEAKPEDDWKDPKTWKHANPQFGAAVTEEFLRDKCQKAIDDPSFENTFKRLHLNLQTEQDKRAIPMDSWNNCPTEIADESVLRELTCFGGLDLSATSDTSAFVLYWPKLKVLKCWFWIANIFAERKRVRGETLQLVDWRASGLITDTEGEVVDYDVIERTILAAKENYPIGACGYDPWNATATVQRLQAEGLQMVEFRQTFKSMSPAAKALLRMVTAQELNHGGNAVLTWMASNAATVEDPDGNIRWSKKKSGEKIDGIVAATVAIGISGLDVADPILPDDQCEVTWVDL